MMIPLNQFCFSLSSRNSCVAETKSYRQVLTIVCWFSNGKVPGSLKSIKIILSYHLLILYARAIYVRNNIGVIFLLNIPVQN